MPDRPFLAKIHIAKKQLGLSEDDYRSLLGQRYGVDSSKALTNTQAADLLAAFEALGWQPAAPSPAAAQRRGWGKARYEHLAGRAGMATPRQLRKIEASWRSLARNPSDAALLAFLERQTGIKRMEWLRKTDVPAVLTALKHMKDDPKTDADHG